MLQKLFFVLVSIRIKLAPRCIWLLLPLYQYLCVVMMVLAYFHPFPFLLIHSGSSFTIPDSWRVSAHHGSLPTSYIEWNRLNEVFSINLIFASVICDSFVLTYIDKEDDMFKWQPCPSNRGHKLNFKTLQILLYVYYTIYYYYIIIIIILLLY